MQNKSIKPEPEYFKCPECGHRTELEYSGAISITKCERCRLFGNRNLWDKWADSERSCLEWRKAYDCLETELERTRKALDVARHTIGWINQMIDEHTDKQAIKIKCEYALDKITALEQKEHFADASKTMEQKDK